MKKYVELNELVKCLLDVKDKNFTDILLAVLNLPTVEFDPVSTLNSVPPILNEPIYTNPCWSCEWYNKPYWSIQSPCLTCNRGINFRGGTISTTQVTATTTADDFSTLHTETRKD